MAKIYVLMGKSSTGKDTVYKRLMQVSGDIFNKVIIYTTRPMREGEQNGVEYNFVSEEEHTRLSELGKIIENRTYNTVYGPWHYFTVADEQIDMSGDNKYLIIATLEAYISFCRYFGKDKVMPIYIEVEDKVRIHRAIAREDEQANPKYSEMCRRFLADEVDFAEEKLAEAEISTRYFNNNLEQCVTEILADIE